MAGLRCPAPGPRHRGHAGDRVDDLRRGDGVPCPAIPHHRHLGCPHFGRRDPHRRSDLGGCEANHVARGRRDRIRGRLYRERLGGGPPYRHRLHRRRSVLRLGRIHRYVHRRPRQRAHGRGRPEQSQRSHYGVHERRRGFGLPRRRAEPPRRLYYLPRLQPGARQSGRNNAVPHRGLRVWRQLRRPVRAARRRHLHEGRRCRCGPRRQGRGRDPGGRPAERRRDCRPGRRQRRRRRWARRGPLRIDVRRKHRRDDSGCRDFFSDEGHRMDHLPARASFVRHHRGHGRPHVGPVLHERRSGQRSGSHAAAQLRIHHRVRPLGGGAVYFHPYDARR